MMDALSLPTRRIVAVGLVILVVTVLVGFVLTPLAAGMADALARLDDARFERAKLAAIVARSPPPSAPSVAADLSIKVPDALAATRALVAILESAATGAGVHATASPAASRDRPLGLIEVGVIIEGPEAGMVGFVNAIERGRPLVRLRNWTLVRSGTPGGVRLTADVAAAWTER